MNKAKILFYISSKKGVTLKRVINILKVLFSFLSKKTKVGGFPPILMIEPTNLCNLRCPLCPTGTGMLKRPSGAMTLDLYRRIIEEIGEYVFHLTLWNWGEPFLSNDIYDMIRLSHNKRIFTRISTNGHFLTGGKIGELLETGLDNLIVAIDGASEETFSFYRQKGDFEKVMRGLEETISMRRKNGLSAPFIELQFMIMRHNEHEIPLIKSISERIGVDRLTFKTVNIAYGPGASEEKIKKFLPQKRAFSRYLPGSAARKVYLKNKCYRLWFSAVINWDGTVVPCCYDADGDFTFGNVGEGSFRSVWNGPPYRRFRKDILSRKKDISLCRECPGTLMGLTLTL